MKLLRALSVWFLVSAFAVVAVDAAPSIGGQPGNLTISSGNIAQFFVSASGTGTLSYQWRRNTVALAGSTFVSGVTASTLTLSNPQVADGGNYDVVVTDSNGSTTSSTATLAVANNAPEIFSQASTIIRAPAGGSARLYANVGGSTPFTMQWKHDGVPLNGPYYGTSVGLVDLFNLVPSQFGTYVLEVSNAYGSTATEPITVMSTATAPYHTWSFRNPLPQGNSLLSLALGPGRIVAVGAGGTIVTSSNGGTSWQIQSAGTQQGLSSVLYDATGGRYLYGGGFTQLATSPDALTWTTRSPPGANENYPGLATDGSRYVAVGGDFSTRPGRGIMRVSTDGGVTWTQANPNTTTSFTSAAFGATRFVAVATNGSVLYSTDGTAWSAATLSPTTGSAFNRVVFANGQFVAVGAGGIVYTSADGTAFTKQTSNTSNNLFGVTWLAGSGATASWAAVGASATVLTSADNAATWTAATAAGPSGLTLNDIASDGTSLYVVGQAGRILKSTTIAGFTAASLADLGSSVRADYSNFMNEVIWDATSQQFVVVSSATSSAGEIHTSPDGQTWTRRASLGTLGQISSVVRFGSQLLVGGLSRIGRSTDNGANWTDLGAISGAAQFRSLAASPSLAVAVGDNGTIFNSADGTSWTASGASGTTARLTKVAYGNNRFVAVGGADNGSNPIVRTSDDGLTWTARTPNTFGQLWGVDYGDGIWMAAGSATSSGGGAFILRSTDNGVTWDRLDLDSPSYINSVRYLGGTWYAVGAAGVLCISHDRGEDWDYVPLPARPGTPTMRGVAVGNGAMVVVGNDGSILKSGSETSPPTVDVQPAASQFVATGARAEIAVAAGRSVSTTYQWRKNGVAIAGATDPTFVIAAAGAGDAGSYDVVITNTIGSVTSNVSKLVVNTPSDDTFPNFAWRSPLPSGGSLQTVIYAQGQFVAAGVGGRILTSADGIAWSLNANPLPIEAVYGLAYTGTQYLAVGASGKIFTASDPNGIWTQRASAPNWLNGVAFAGGMHVAVGYNGTILSSADGIGWTVRTSPTSAPLNSVAGTTGRYVAVGQNGTIVTSTDAIAWSSVAAPGGYGAMTFNSVDYLNSQFIVAGSNGTVLTSADGLTWTARATGAFDWLRRVVYAGGRYVITGDGGSALVSTDLTTWNRYSIDTSAPLFGQAAGGGLFVTVGGGGEVWSSTDGQSWISRGSTGGNYRFADLIATHDDGDEHTFIAVGSNGSIALSDDAVSWTRPRVPGGPWLNGIAPGGELGVAVSGFGDILVTNDGVTWTNRTVGDNVSNNGVAGGNRRFVAVGDGGKVRVSTDGFNWTSSTLPGVSSSLRSVAALNDASFIAVGDGGRIFTSVDGAAWTPRVSGTTENLQRVRVIDGTAFALGDNRTLLLSTDGATWLKIPQPTDYNTFGYSYRDIARLPDGYYIASSQGQLLKSPRLSLTDASTWTRVAQLAFGENLFAIVAAGNKVVVAGDGGTLLESTLPAQSVAPSIAVQPQGATFALGSNVVLGVVANGRGELHYEWRRGGQPVPGGMGAVLVLHGAQAADAGSYTVVVSSNEGSVTSAAAVLTAASSTLSTSINFENYAPGAAQLVTEPFSGFTGYTFSNTATLGGIAGDPIQGVLATSALGTGQAAYFGGAGTNLPLPATDTFFTATIFSGRFEEAPVKLSGSATPLRRVSVEFLIDRNGGTNQQGLAFYVFDAVDAADANTFGFHSFVRVNADNTVSLADNNFNYQATAITLQPDVGYRLVLEVDYDTATWSATIAAINGSVSYPVATNRAINVNGYTLSGWTTPGTLDIEMGAVASASSHALADRFLIDNLQIANLAVGPVISTPPANVTVTSGQMATLGVTVADPTGVTYQWRRDGFAIPGATGSTYTIAGARRADAGFYDVVATSPAGSTVSATAQVSVAPTAYPGQLTAEAGYEPNPLSVSTRVYASLPLPDGKWLVGGDFVQWGDTPRYGIARLNADFSLDATFTPPVVSGIVHALARAADGTIYFGGEFNAVGGQLRPGLARLTSAGGFDATWQPQDNPPLGSIVSALALQSDGKLLVARNSFPGAKVVAVPGASVLRRLLADGTLDSSFTVDVTLSAFAARLHTIIVEPSGAIVFAGGLTAVNSSSRTGLARVSSAGVLDGAFGGSTGANNPVNTLTRLADGRYLVGGQFTQIAGQNRNRLALLDSSGAVDSTFVPTSTGTTTGAVQGAALLSDGGVLAGGNFVLFAGSSTFGLVRLSSTGAVVQTYSVSGAGAAVALPSTASGVSLRAYPLAGDDVALFGMFQAVLNQRRIGVAVVKPDGTLAASPATVAYRAAFVSNAFLEADEKLTVIGSLDTGGGATNLGQLQRLNLNGTADTSFPGGTGFTLDGTNFVYRAVRQADGKTIAVGGFLGYNGTNANRLVRFNADGSIDGSFNAGSGPSSYLIQPLPLAGGKLLLHGLGFNFTFNGASATGLLRLNADGTRDIGFNPGTAIGTTTATAAVEYPGSRQVYLAGGFTAYNGTAVPGFVRINEDGTRDASFNPGTGVAGGTVSGLQVLRGGRILLFGSFTSYNGNAANRIAIVSPSGAFDASFAAATAIDGTVGQVVEQEDGRLIAVGDFSGGPAVRLTGTGAADPTFGLLGITGFPGGTGAALRLTIGDDGSVYAWGGVPLAVDLGMGRTLMRFRAAPTPTIATATTTRTLAPGGSATLTVAASGQDLSYQWSRNGTALAGATGASYAIANASAAEAGVYAVTVTNVAGAVTRTIAVVTVATFSDTFTGVGDLPGGIVGSQVRAVSEDGKVAVGSGSVLVNQPSFGNGDRAFRWTALGGLTELPNAVTVTGGTTFVTASDLTDDGTMIAGRARTGANNGVRVPALFTNAGATLSPLPLIAGYTASLQAATGISADGTVVYGFGSDANGRQQAFRWTAAGGTVGLGFLHETDGISIPAGRGVSADGSVMVGSSGTASAFGAGSTAFIYTVGSGLTSIGFLPGGTWSSSLAVTADGATVFGVGNSTAHPTGEFFLWTRSGGLVALGSPSGSSIGNFGGISADASVQVVKDVIHNSHGFVTLADLFAIAGLPAAGWSELSAFGVTDNGNVLFGYGRNPGGNYEGWVATFRDGYLAMIAAPMIRDQPFAQRVVAGGAVEFVVSATGQGALTYQWSKDGSPISGATGTRLMLDNLTAANAGNYRVAVTDSNGTTPSTVAALTVVTPDPILWQQNLQAATAAGFDLSPGRTIHDGQGGIYLPWTIYPNGVDVVGGRFNGQLVRLRESDGTLDPAFKLDRRITRVAFAAMQADHKVILGCDAGDASTIVRVDATGAIDSTFHAPFFKYNARFLSLQPDGKVLVAATDLAALSPPAGALDPGHPALYRLNTDGTLDTGFTPAVLTNGGVVYAPPVVDASGRIYLVGAFSAINGVPRVNIARLSSAGVLDAAYANPATLPAGFAGQMARGLAFQSDGRAVLVGAFRYTARGTSSDSIMAIRLNTDGTLDSGFAQPLRSQLGLSSSQRLRYLVMLPDDRFVAVSDRVVWFTANGSVDSDYPSRVLGQEAFWISRASDGRWFVPFEPSVAGNATNLPLWASGLAVLKPDGTPDTSFQTGGWGQAAFPTAANVLSDGRVVLGGSFNRFGGTRAPGVAMFNSAGGFASGQPAIVRPANAADLPNASVADGGGDKTYLAWSDTRTTDLSRLDQLIRINADGSADASFVPQIPGSISLSYIELLPAPGGKLILATPSLSDAAALAGNTTSAGVRLNADGSVDGGFTMPVSSLARVDRDAGNHVTMITLGSRHVAQALPDGRLLLVLGATDGTVRLQRLNADGAVDDSFTTPALGTLPASQGFTTVLTDALTGDTGQFSVTYYGTSAIVRCARQMADGKVYVGGSLSLGGAPRALVRLNADGSLDATFSGAGAAYDAAPFAAAPLVTALTTDSSGRLYVAGRLDHFNGVATPGGLFRLTAAGAVDASWAPGVAVMDYPSLAVSLLEKANKLYVFGTIGGTADAYPGAYRVIALDPSIATEPAAQAVTVGGTATFAVTAGGTAPFTYQWFKDGNAIDGATGATLTLTNVQSAAAGTYTVVVTNGLGQVTSHAAQLTVNAVAPTSGLASGSARVTVGAGAHALTAAFTVEGTTGKQMLIRAVGPSLATFGIMGFLADPQLEIVNATTGSVVASNDDWGSAANAAQVTSASQQYGALPLTGGSKDAVVLGTFAPGTYRARVNGANATTGIVLLDIYDADATPRLVYLAARVSVGSGNAQLIQGLVLNPLPAGRSYLIRALGPSLGLAGGLTDPQLSILTTGASSTTVASNDNWGGDSTLATLAAGVGAMPLPGASKDAAVAFAPADGGVFTAIVSGVGGASGLALLEVFEADAQRAATLPAAIVSQPENLTITAGQAATFGVVTVGKPAPSYQWRKNTVAIGGATSARLAIDPAATTDAGNYDVVVTNSGGTATSATAVLTVNAAPTAPAITSQPASTTIASGQTAALTVIAGGTSPLSYQWYQGASGVTTTPMSGATSATFTTPALTATTGYWVRVTNGVGSADSQAATVTIQSSSGTTATHAVVGFGYLAGGTVTITNTITFSGTASAIGWSVTLPDGWSFASSAGTNVPGVTPTAGETGTIGWAYTSVPTSPATFSYTVNVPVGETVTRSLSATLFYRAGGNPEQVIVATPDPLLVPAAPARHSADTNLDGKFSLSELLRVIELYNTRNGTTRTGRYAVQAGTEDGFATDALTANNATVTLAIYHSGDTNRDGKLSLSELLRVIELYNFRNGTTRTGQYHALRSGESASEDGFAPGA